MRLVAVLALSIVLAACTVDHPVQLEIDTAAPISCVERVADGGIVPLVARALTPGHRDDDVLYVFDFVRTPSVPRCEPSTIVTECVAAATRCAAVPSARACLRIPRERLDLLTADDLDDLRLSDLITGTPEILGDAPEGTVMVRLVITLEGDGPSPCPPEGGSFDVLPSFDPELLLGCGYSCPIVVEEESQIEIDLDPVRAGGVCDASAIAICAGLGL